MKPQIPRSDAARVLRRFFLWLGCCAALLVSPGSFSLARANTGADVNEIRAKMEAAANLAPLEAINRRYHEHGRDPADNAAPLYEQASAARVSEGLPHGELAEALAEKKVYRPIPPERWKAIGRVVEANQDAIRLYKKAAAYSYFRRELDLTKGPDLVLGHLGTLRAGAKLLAGEALIAAKQGNPVRSAEAMGAIFGIAVHLSEEPTTVSQLTRMAIEGLGKKSLQRALTEVEFPPALLASLQAQVHRAEMAPRMEDALETEVAQIRKYMPLATEEDGETMRADLTEVEKVLAKGKLPHAERVKIDWEAGVTAGPSAGETFASIVVPTVGRVLLTDSRTVTGLRAARIALAAERMRMEKGALPETLADLVPGYLEKLPIDPFADGAFKFVREGDAWFVRSRETITFKGDGGEVLIQFRLPVR